MDQIRKLSIRKTITNSKERTASEIKIFFICKYFARVSALALYQLFGSHCNYTLMYIYKLSGSGERVLCIAPPPTLACGGLASNVVNINR
jgi:hypothetical protein